MEYYIQERLGYELQVDILRDPFFTSKDRINNHTLFLRGTKITFRQKFYHENQKYGMLYFGHQLSFSYSNHQVNYLDTMVSPTNVISGSMIESGFGYGVFVGNRWMSNVGDSGWTIDTFIGMKIANRNFSPQYGTNPTLDAHFDPFIKSSVHFPVIAGLNIGISRPDNKSKTQ